MIYNYLYISMLMHQVKPPRVAVIIWKTLLTPDLGLFLFQKISNPPLFYEKICLFNQILNNYDEK